MSFKKSEKRSGFVTILGRPNVGKSTLLNCLAGEKLAGVSPKPQTTRGLIRAIVTQPEGQIIFVDTPGIHQPRDFLGDWMMQEAQKTLSDADLIYFMVLPGTLHPEDHKILEMIQPVTAPVILVVSQIDRFPKPEILPVLEQAQRLYAFREFIPVSAVTGEQIPLLLRKTFEHLPTAEPYFPEDQISDQQERVLAAEMIREKLYHFTGEEIPYASTVVIESFKEDVGARHPPAGEAGASPVPLIRIDATVVVEKDSQKAIVIGKGGEKMKQIGTSARHDLERFLGRKVFLKLWVKVVPHWKRDRAALKQLGYE